MPPPEAEPSSLKGTRISGKYRIRKLLGKGGMGRVYKAENVAIGRTVALKLLLPDLAEDGVTLARFTREARVAASAHHEHVVEIFDMGVTDEGAPYIVMEYVRGRSLAEELEAKGRLGVARAVDIASQILSALAAVHDRGVVHRDLKSQNVLLTMRRGRTDFVKLLDFGIATFVESIQDMSAGLDLTPSGRTMVSPSYASPEQLLGDAGRHARVDVYAVGVLLYEMLSGQLPFRGKRPFDLWKAILESPPPPLSARCPELPEGLEAVILRALHKEPEARYQSAAELVEALVPFGAEPLLIEEPDPSDTFTQDLRDLRIRELRHTPQRPKPRPDERGREEPEPASAHAVLGATVVRSLCAFLKERLDPNLLGELGERAGVALPELPEEGEEGLFPDDALRLLEAADRATAGGDRRLVAEAGRALAELLVDREQALTPELFFATAPDLLSAHFGLKKRAKAQVARGRGRLSLVSPAGASLALPVLLAGFLDAALALTGARGARVRLVEAVALGERRDVLDASWTE